LALTPVSKAALLGSLRIDAVSYDHPDAARLIEEVQQAYVVRYGGRDDSPSTRPSSRRRVAFSWSAIWAASVWCAAAGGRTAPTPALASALTRRSSGCTLRPSRAGAGWPGGYSPSWSARPAPRGITG
jgi:hypothetical protein